MRQSFELKKIKNLDYEIIELPQEGIEMLNGEYQYLKALIEIKKLQIMVNHENFPVA